MHKYLWWQRLLRFFLWSHVVGVIGFYLGLWLRTLPGKEDRVKPLDPDTSPGAASTARVSIILPARDEELNIRRCVESLLEQDYDNYEVIVVDDCSTDATASILADIGARHPHRQRLKVLHLHELPPGWAGKPHAIHSGTQEASGDWLLFTDADTWHAPVALRSALAHAQAEQLDLFSMSAAQELPLFWDKTLIPVALMGISMLYPPRQVNDPTSPVAIAGGQYILIKHEVYDTLGGYARPEMRATLLDDRDLAYLVKHQGFRLRFVDGGGLVTVRMYRNFDEIWRGWRKNAYLGNRGGLLFVLLQLIGLPMITIVPFLLPLLGRRKWGIRPREAATATALELAILFPYRIWLNRQTGAPWYYALTHWLGGAIFTGILGQSTWRILTRTGVDWRGREYHNDNGRK
jgi:chlorobactene glucosyltransferase